MFKVLKNLKESWISVIAIVLLLVVQAAGDLTLPDYTSKIVNVGIQNGGIENVAPEVIRKSEMENMLIFTEGDDKILASYEEISKENLDNKEYEKLVKKYAQTVTTVKHITPHKLRSTYGTNLYRETGDIYLVADVLGHNDVNTTKKHYAALEDDRRRGARNAVKLRDWNRVEK